MTSQTPSLSFEVFPPNPAVGNEKILRALEEDVYKRQVLSPICVASITASPEVTTVPRKTLSSVKRSEESGLSLIHILVTQLLSA